MGRLSKRTIQCRLARKQRDLVMSEWHWDLTLMSADPALLFDQYPLSHFESHTPSKFCEVDVRA